jgi:hypothetical protein
MPITITTVIRRRVEPPPPPEAVDGTIHYDPRDPAGFSDPGRRRYDDRSGTWLRVPDPDPRDTRRPAFKTVTPRTVAGGSPYVVRDRVTGSILWRFRAWTRQAAQSECDRLTLLSGGRVHWTRLEDDAC